MSKKVLVAILNWNGQKHLSEFLPSVVMHSSDVAEILVIDNASTDDSVVWLSTHFPQVRVKQNPFNAGFAGGYNLGLKDESAEYFVLLNSDVEVTPNWILPVIGEMEKDEKIVAAQPSIRAFLKQTHYEHAGAAGGYMDKDLYPFCRGRIFGNVEPCEGQYPSVEEVFWATGACLFIRGNAFKEVGGFDHDFFAHMEEIDLCWRLKNRGYRIIAVPQSTVLHLGGGTLNYESPGKTYLNFRNNLWAIHKNYFESNLFLKIFRRLCMDGLAGIRFLLKGNFRHLWAIVRAHFAYYRAMQRLNKQRATERQFKQSLNRKGWYKKSITIGFFLGGKKKFYDLKKEDFYA
jgi:GT2 family glycosyltransferase